MTDYTKYKRGSEWRKWDLHIHTPETKKNDQYEGATVTEKWDNFIETINASTEEISVVGITDYFCIENYFKFKEAITSGKITKNFDLVLPNIEIRVLPVTASATPINLHCIFNPLIEGEIQTRFLSKLEFSFNDSNFSAKKEELIRLGRALPGSSSLGEDLAWKAGISQYVVGMDTLRKIFEKDQKLRDNTIIVVSNKSNDGASGIRKHSDFFISSGVSQLDATRWSIYQFSNAIFSSNQNDVLYFTGIGSDPKNVVIEKCAALMPCFHGCDAHSNYKVFKPDENRFCWIKADPTFEGLKQTLYEPEDRVKIQALKPDVKNERHIISDLQFISSGNLFSDKKILLSENLNSIIGGKSSGKSLLLFSTAKSIDPDQVERTAKRLKFEGYNFDSTFDLKVTWKNGDVDLLSSVDPLSKLHKITYIPQLYINHLVEKNNKEELNSLIKSILLQDAGFKAFFEGRYEEIAHISSEIESLLNKYFEIRNKGRDLQQRSKDLGNSENIKKSITKFEADIIEGQKATNLNEDEAKQYSELFSTKANSEIELRILNSKIYVLIKLVAEIEANKISLLGKIENNIPATRGEIDRILDELGDVSEEIKAIKGQIKTDYETLESNVTIMINNLDLVKKRDGVIEKLEKISKSLEPLLKKLSGQTELQKLTGQLELEKIKLQNASILEAQIKSLFDEYAQVRKQTADLLRRRFEQYQKIEEKINSTRTDIGADIELKCSLIYKLNDFALFNQVNKTAIGSDHYFNTFFTDGKINYGAIVDFYEKNLRIADDKLVYGKDESIPLKVRISHDDILRGLVKDAFELDYTVTYKGDNLLSMSPGKKGTVLLILFLQISSSEYPILIDQPEDNLDNRTIYDLLCQMIKAKKKDRQIIIVSHNANLVVATDTENIIVANQQGQDTSSATGRYRFEYVNGSLEYSFPKNTSIPSILLSQGIREHVCDILEGGNEAFKQRERKYSIR